MNIILLLIGSLNVIFFINNWKKLFYIFIFLLPFTGYIQHKVQVFTIFAPLLHDIIFILPLYFIILLNNIKINILPNDLFKLIIFFILLLLVQLFNPLNNFSFLARIVSLKVWIFYFFFIILGYHLINDKKDLKFFCNFFTIVAIIPCIIGILQYIFSLTLGYEETMTFFHNSRADAYNSTQGFTKFKYGFINIFRIPSTFSYIGQYLNFLIVALIPSITSIALSSNKKEKSLYKFVLYLIIIAILLTGARAAIVFLLIFLIFFIKNFYGFKKIKFLPVLTILITICLIILYNQSELIRTLYTLGVNYIFNYFFIDFFENIIKYFFGIGLGNATSGARYIDQALAQSLTGQHEGYYWKAVFELGFFGAILIIVLFFNYLKQVNIVKNKLLENDESIICSCVYAYICFQMISAFKTWVNFDGYPSNFLFFLFIGIVLKMGSKTYTINS